MKFFMTKILVVLKIIFRLSSWTYPRLSINTGNHTCQIKINEAFLLSSEARSEAN